MIDKNHLRQTMLELTEAELEQARETYERFLASARLDQTEPVENDEQAQAETAADLAEAFDDRAHEVAAKISAIEAMDFSPKSTVEPGAAVRLGDRYVVVGVSTGTFSCQGRTFVGISQAAPIYQALEGLQKGDTVEFRGRRLKISEVV